MEICINIINNIVNMKSIKNFINESQQNNVIAESSNNDVIFKNEESLSVLSSLILFACNNFKKFMGDINTIGQVEDKDLTEDKVKKYLQAFDNEISSWMGIEDSELKFK